LVLSEILFFLGVYALEFAWSLALTFLSAFYAFFTLAATAASLCLHFFSAVDLASLAFSTLALSTFRWVTNFFVFALC
jgi:hypothetical protein